MEKTVQKRSLWNRIWRNRGLYLMLLPSVILLLCFTYKPMYGVIIAFKDYKPARGIMGSDWVGFKHFLKFFSSYQFGSSIRNTLTLSIYSLFASFPLPIVLALLLNQMKWAKFKRFFQTVSYLPHFISTVVMVGLLLIFLSPSFGLIGALFSLFGAKAPNLMGSASAFKHIYVWSDIWQHTGWDSIIYIAALSAVDPSLYEAAVVDGANKWKKMLHIDLPMIMPTAITLLIMRAGSLMSVGFEKAYLMQNSMNTSASEIISTVVYKIGLLNSQYSYSAAIGLFNTIINLILLVLVNQISKRLTENSLW